jgi:hypothetical protein
MGNRPAPEGQGHSAGAGPAWPPKFRIQLDTDVLSEAAKRRVAQVLEQALQDEFAKTPPDQRVIAGAQTELVFGAVPPRPPRPR